MVDTENIFLESCEEKKTLYVSLESLAITKLYQAVHSITQVEKDHKLGVMAEWLRASNSSSGG